jgi:YD repeat-containing protein
VVGPKNAAGLADSEDFTYYADTTSNYSAGDLASAVNAVGEVTRFLEYTTGGLARKISRNDGVVVHLEYDSRQRITSITHEDGTGGMESTRYSYDPAGQLVRLQLPDSYALTLGYDDAHRLNSITDDEGNRLSLVRNASGDVTRNEVRNSEGNLAFQSIRIFDALNRLETIRHNLQSTGETFHYDHSGNLISHTDGLRRVSTRAFDQFGRISRKISPPFANAC